MQVRLDICCDIELIVSWVLGLAEVALALALQSCGRRDDLFYGTSVSDRALEPYQGADLCVHVDHERKTLTDRLAANECDEVRPLFSAPKPQFLRIHCDGIQRKDLAGMIGTSICTGSAG